jgi:hypothetical protein
MVFRQFCDQSVLIHTGKLEKKNDSALLAGTSQDDGIVLKDFTFLDPMWRRTPNVLVVQAIPGPKVQGLLFGVKSRLGFLLAQEKTDDPQIVMLGLFVVGMIDDSGLDFGNLVGVFCDQVLHDGPDFFWTGSVFCRCVLLFWCTGVPCTDATTRLAGHGRECLLTKGFTESVADAEVGNSNDGLLSHSLYYPRSTRCRYIFIVSLCCY